PGQPRLDLAGDRDAEFVAQPLGRGDQLGTFRPEDDLRDAVAVADVDEHELALVAVGVHPAVERNRLPIVGLAQFPAGVRPLPACHVHAPARSTHLPSPPRLAAFPLHAEDYREAALRGTLRHSADSVAASEVRAGWSLRPLKVLTCSLSFQ